MKNNLMRVPFELEDFKTLIFNTFEKWYGFERTRDTFQEYTEVIEKNDLMHEFGRFLEINSTNLLTNESMPIIDMGEKPSSYDPKATEAAQVFIAPKSQYPNRMIVKYGEYRPQFHVKKLSNKYKKSALHEAGVDYLTLENTLTNASRFL